MHLRYIRMPRRKAESPLSVEEIVARDGPSHALQVAIVGVGGAGNNILCHAISQGVDPKNCTAVNTDRTQLSESLAQNKVYLTNLNGTSGPGYVQRRGTVELLAHRVVPFTRESDFTILLTGLGGVTGTRTAPMIAQLHRSQVRPVIAVVALPFIHERERRFVALRGLKKMVDACDCTVIIDNAVEKEALSGSELVADETSAMAVRSLSDVVAMDSPAISHRILHILSLGAVATVCTGQAESNERIQSAVIGALRTPSAALPITKAKGAVMLHRGPKPLNAVQAAHAYEAIASLAGHDVEFVQASAMSPVVSSVSIFLTGYSYGMTLGTFVDLIDDLYDMEYGLESGSAEIGLPTRLYQMEGA